MKVLQLLYLHVAPEPDRDIPIYPVLAVLAVLALVLGARLAWRYRHSAGLKRLAHRGAAVVVVVALAPLVFPYDHAGVTIEAADGATHAAHCHGERSECLGSVSSVDVPDAVSVAQINCVLDLDKLIPPFPAVNKLDGWDSTSTPPPRV
jgi:hypothetical protein